MMTDTFVERPKDLTAAKQGETIKRIIEVHQIIDSFKQEVGVFESGNEATYYQVLGLEPYTEDVNEIQRRIDKQRETYSSENYPHSREKAVSVLDQIREHTANIPNEAATQKTISDYEGFIKSAFPPEEEFESSDNNPRKKIVEMESIFQDERKKRRYDIETYNHNPIEFSYNTKDGKVSLAVSKGTKKIEGESIQRLKQVCEDDIGFIKSKSGNRAFFVADGVSTAQGAILSKALGEAFRSESEKLIDSISPEQMGEKIMDSIFITLLQKAHQNLLDMGVDIDTSSTFGLVVVVGNRLFSKQIGDSRTFVISQNNPDSPKLTNTPHTTPGQPNGISGYITYEKNSSGQMELSIVTPKDGGVSATQHDYLTVESHELPETQTTILDNDDIVILTTDGLLRNGFNDELALLRAMTTQTTEEYHLEYVNSNSGIYKTRDDCASLRYRHESVKTHFDNLGQALDQKSPEDLFDLFYDTESKNFTVNRKKDASFYRPNNDYVQVMQDYINGNIAEQQLADELGFELTQESYDKLKLWIQAKTGLQQSYNQNEMIRIKLEPVGLENPEHKGIQVITLGTGSDQNIVIDNKNIPKRAALIINDHGKYILSPDSEGNSENHIYIYNDPTPPIPNEHLLPAEKIDEYKRRYMLQPGHETLPSSVELKPGMIVSLNDAEFFMIGSADDGTLQMMQVDNPSRRPDEIVSNVDELVAKLANLEELFDITYNQETLKFNIKAKGQHLVVGKETKKTLAELEERISIEINSEPGRQSPKPITSITRYSEELVTKLINTHPQYAYNHNLPITIVDGLDIVDRDCTNADIVSNDQNNLFIMVVNKPGSPYFMTAKINDDRKEGTMSVAYLINPKNDESTPKFAAKRVVETSEEAPLKKGTVIKTGDDLFYIESVSTDALIMHKFEQIKPSDSELVANQKLGRILAIADTFETAAGTFAFLDVVLEQMTDKPNTFQRLQSLTNRQPNLAQLLQNFQDYIKAVRSAENDTQERTIKINQRNKLANLNFTSIDGQTKNFRISVSSKPLTTDRSNNTYFP